MRSHRTRPKECVDLASEKNCKRIKARNECYKKNALQKCLKTCEFCNDEKGKKAIFLHIIIEILQCSTIGLL